MRLLADENIAAPLVLALRGAGHDVTYVAELAPGITDEAVLAQALRQGRPLLTEDKDFGDLVFSLKRHPPGIVPLRFREPGWLARLGRLQALFAGYSARLQGTYTVVDSRRFRFRTM